MAGCKQDDDAGGRSPSSSSMDSSSSTHPPNVMSRKPGWNMPVSEPVAEATDAWMYAFQSTVKIDR